MQKGYKKKNQKKCEKLSIKKKKRNYLISIKENQIYSLRKL